MQHCPLQRTAIAGTEAGMGAGGGPGVIILPRVAWGTVGSIPTRECTVG